MGLDVYLRKNKNLEDSKKREAEYSKRVDELWEAQGKKYDEYSKEEKDVIREKSKVIAEELNLDEWGSSKDEEEIKIDSKKYPEAYFKIGYFRSSYNPGGINRILRNMNLMDLDDIFNPDDQYEFKPDWQAALGRIDETLLKINEIRDKNESYAVECFNTVNMRPQDGEVENEAQALELFLKMKHEEHSFTSFSNAKGEFHLKEPLEVVALIKGVKKWGFMTDSPERVVYVIHKQDISSYIQSLEIVKETIEYVLAQADKEHYFLAWSA